MQIIRLLISTSYDINKTLGYYTTVCSYTGNKCNGFVCKSSPIDCQFFSPILIGFTYKQLIFFSTVFEYLEKEKLLDSKFTLVEVLNAYYGTDKSIKTENVSERNAMLTMKFMFPDFFENAEIQSASGVDGDITRFFLEMNPEKKEKRYKSLYENTRGKVKHIPALSSVLTMLDQTDTNRGKIMTVMKIILKYPYHRNIIVDNLIKEGIKKEVNQFKLHSKTPSLTPLDMLKGGWDKERADMMLKNPDTLDKLIAYHDNYYLLYKEFFTSKDKDFWLILEVEEYLDKTKETQHYAKVLQDYMIEKYDIDLIAIGNKMKSIIDEDNAN